MKKKKSAGARYFGKPVTSDPDDAPELLSDFFRHGELRHGEKLVRRTRKFAEILARAATLFGSRAAAEQWLEQPAIGLDHRRPIDLMATPAGLELVEDYLGRIEYGVYT
jgi:putative toxin-antitoxin system antitoxin component (TIGR02293 family)